MVVKMLLQKFGKISKKIIGGGGGSKISLLNKGRGNIANVTDSYRGWGGGVEDQIFAKNSVT